MANDFISNSRTRHIERRHLKVRELVEEGKGTRDPDHVTTSDPDHGKTVKGDPKRNTLTRNERETSATWQTY